MSAGNAIKSDNKGVRLSFAVHLENVRRRLQGHRVQILQETHTCTEKMYFLSYA